MTSDLMPGTGGQTGADKATFTPILSAVLRGQCTRMELHATHSPLTTPLPNEVLACLTRQEGQLGGILLLLLGWTAKMDEVILSNGKPTRDDSSACTTEEMKELCTRLGERSNIGFCKLLNLLARKLDRHTVQQCTETALEGFAQQGQPSAGRRFKELLQKALEPGGDAAMPPAAAPEDRPYQREVIEKAKDKDAIVVLPPGTGKSECPSLHDARAHRASPQDVWPFHVSPLYNACLSSQRMSLKG